MLNDLPFDFSLKAASNALSLMPVVVSKNNLKVPGVMWVATPKEALAYLGQKGHKTALLSGGESLHNAFLAQDLVDELVLNIAPTLESKGLNLLLQEGQYREVRLLTFKDIGGGIVQLRYAVSH